MSNKNSKNNNLPKFFNLLRKAFVILFVIFVIFSIISFLHILNDKNDQKIREKLKQEIQNEVLKNYEDYEFFRKLPAKTEASFSQNSSTKSKSEIKLGKIDNPKPWVLVDNQTNFHLFDTNGENIFETSQINFLTYDNNKIYFRKNREEKGLIIIDTEKKEIIEVNYDFNVESFLTIGNNHFIKSINHNKDGSVLDFSFFKLDENYLNPKLFSKTDFMSYPFYRNLDFIYSDDNNFYFTSNEDYFDYKNIPAQDQNKSFYSIIKVQKDLKNHEVFLLQVNFENNPYLCDQYLVRKKNVDSLFKIDYEKDWKDLYKTDITKCVRDKNNYVVETQFAEKILYSNFNFNIEDILQEKRQTRVKDFDIQDFYFDKCGEIKTLANDTYRKNIVFPNGEAIMNVRNYKCFE